MNRAALFLFFLTLMGLGGLPLSSVWASDSELRLSTSNGSTHWAIQNLTGLEVSSFTSAGDAFFNGTLYTETNREFIPVGGIINRDTSNVTDSNSTTETQLYSVFLPAGILSTNRGIRITMRGQFVQNSGAARSWTLKLKLGSTFAAATVVATKAASIATSATSGDFFAEFILANTLNASTQEAAVSFLGDRSGTPVSICGEGTGAVNTGSDETAYVSITFPATTATQTFTKTAAYTVLE